MFEWVHVTRRLEGTPSFFQRDDRLRGLLGYRVVLYIDLDRRVRLHRRGTLEESKIDLPKIRGV